MLVKIINNYEENLIFEISTTNSQDSCKTQKLKIDIIEVLLELLNSNKIPWKFLLMTHYTEEQKPTLKERVVNLDVTDSTKNLLKLFYNAYNFKSVDMLHKNLLLTEQILSDIRLLPTMKNVKKSDIAYYFENKYMQNTEVTINEFALLAPCNPFLWFYEISVEEFFNILLKCREKRNYTDLLEWVQPFIKDELHFKLLSRIVEFLSYSPRRSAQQNWIEIFSIDEFLSYQNLVADYEKECREYLVSKLQEIMALAIIHIYKSGATIKTCISCGKYFVAENKNAKACSDNCKNKRKQTTKKKRNTYPCCEKSTQTIETLQNRLETYGKNKNCNDIVYWALYNVIEYYRDVSNVVRKAIRENIKDVQHDKRFLDNFDKWCDKIILETPEINKMKKDDDITYYELLPNSYKAIKYKHFVHKKFTYFDEE